MESKIAKALQLKHQGVAIITADEAPADALRFKSGKWGCVMFMFANAARGKTAAFDRESYGCWGGGVGLGFGNVYEKFPGGVDCFTYFLSAVGNEQWEKGREVGKMLEGAAGKEFARDFLKGEAYFKSPQLVHRFLDELPIQDMGRRFVVFKPLNDADPSKDQIATVVFLANPDQLSALVVLANYGRGGINNVIIPFAAGCQSIGIIPFKEAASENPRAVVGLMDISARKYTRSLIGMEYLTFAMPWNLFQEMESNVEGSFLQSHTWMSLVGK